MGDTIAVSDEANAALKEWGDARGALDHCEKRFRDAETTLHWMTQDSKHFREFSDFDLQDFQAPEEAYAMAYNDGHRDGRNKTGYDPTVVKLDRQTFREAYKMRAESFEAPHAFRDDRCDNCERSVITEQDMKRIHIYRDDDDGWKNEYQVCEPCYGILIEEEDYYSAESFESVTDEWIINRKRSNPLSRHYIPQKSAEGDDADYRWKNCDNERSFLISILSDRQLDEFLEFEEDSYSAETKLGKDSCCCGATKTNPCACMIQGVMDCNATCPCSLAKKNAEYVSPFCEKVEKTQRWTDGRYKCDQKVGHKGLCGAWSRSSSGRASPFEGHAPCKHIIAGKFDCGCILGDGVDDSTATRISAGLSRVLGQKNAESDSEWNCVICGHKSTGYGHNPEPVASFQSGRCCDTCNATVVIPARLRGSFRAEEGSSCPVCGTHTEVIREYFDDDTSWVDLIVCDNCCWMEELEGNEEEYEAYMEEMLAMLDEEPDADLLEKPNVEVDTSWDWSDGVGPPPSQQTLDITFDVEVDGIDPTITGICPHCKEEVDHVGTAQVFYCPACHEDLGPSDIRGDDEPADWAKDVGLLEAESFSANRYSSKDSTWISNAGTFAYCAQCGLWEKARKMHKVIDPDAAESDYTHTLYYCDDCGVPAQASSFLYPGQFFRAEGEELTDEEKQEGWNQFQEEAASIEDPDLEQIKTLADKYLLDIIDDETPEFFVDPGLEDYYQYILTDPTYPEGGEPEDEEAAAMFEELKHVRYWATILTDEHIKQADTAAKAMMAAGLMGQDKELFDQGMLGLETNNQVQRERELIAQWLAEGGVHEN